MGYCDFYSATAILHCSNYSAKGKWFQQLEKESQVCCQWSFVVKTLIYNGDVILIKLDQEL